MQRGRYQRIMVWTLAAAFLVCVGIVGKASAAQLLVNGDFETGDFTGWTVTNVGNTGGWYVDSDGTTPVSSHPTVGPYEGTYYAVSDQVGPGVRSLTQTFTVANPSQVILSFYMFVNDWDAGPIINPAGLTYTAGPNQHARVDILTEGAGPFETGASVLANYYLGIDGSNAAFPWIYYEFDISGIVGGGGTFQIRFAEVDTNFWFNMGVDDVHVETVPEPSTLLLLGSGLFGLVGFRRKFRK